MPDDCATSASQLRTLLGGSPPIYTVKLAIRDTVGQFGPRIQAPERKIK
jgi:hypothetical protein